MKKDMENITDKDLLEFYSKGWLDELSGSSSVVPNNTLITKAYNIGANHATLGDDNKSFDYLSNCEVLKIIKG